MAMTPDDLMFKPGLLKGHRILITGGGTGLGKEMAEGCLLLGAEVFICGRRGGVLEETAKELRDRHGGSITAVACACTSEILLTYSSACAPSLTAASARAI